MAGVNKVILVGNLGADPEVAVVQQWRRSGKPAHRDVGELEGPRRQPPGKDRMALGCDLQREPRPGRQELPQEGLQGLSSKASCRPASGRTSPATTATRPRSSFRNSAASWCCSTSREGGGGGGRGSRSATASVAVTISAAAAASVSSRVRSRRRSTPTWTTTFPSKACRCRRPSAAPAPRTGWPAPRSSCPLP